VGVTVPETYEKLEASRDSRDLSYTADEVRAGVHALAEAMRKRVGDVEALDAARNMATGLRDLSLLGGMTAADAIRMSAEGRRKAWPRSPWARLSDADLDLLAAEGAVAWERGVRAGRGGRR
jgi:hypothetical protein